MTIVQERLRASGRMLRTGLIVFAALIGIALIAHSLSQYHPAELVDAVERFPSARALAALGFAAGSYLCLTFFDYLGLRYAGCNLPWRKAALASFTSLSLGHNIGFSALSAGVLRYRFYSRWGANAEQVVKVILISATSVVVGLGTLAGFAVLVEPAAIQFLGNVPKPLAVIVGLLVPVGYIGACLLLRISYVYKGVTLQLPSPQIACLQIAAGTLNFICVTACLQQCLLAVHEIDFTKVAAAYVAGNIVTIVSHVPGGLGVLETVVQFVLGKQSVILPLLMFRLIYFIIPLLLGSLALIGSEAYFKRNPPRP